ncbi:E3 ubiquitin-protein ligase [Schistosoma japonicum]|nr:E3 ubiquitin-protein ligase [Schistosoma japonicum]
MYGRRRAAALPHVSRRHGDVATADTVQHVDCAEVTIDTLHSRIVNRSRPVGVSFISSSSSSDSSGSPPPLTRRTRQIRRIDRTHLSQRSTANLRSRSRGVSGNSESNNPNIAISLPRRSRRRAFVHPPFFELLFSQGNPSYQNESTGESVRTNQDDFGDVSIQLTRTEDLDPNNRPGRLRTTRSGRRITRRLSATNSRTVPPTNISSVTNPSLANSSRRSQSLIDCPDVQAALAAARSTGLESDDDCVICLCEKSNRCVVLPCMHTFCYDCIYRWLCINPSCPLCKRLAQKIIHSVLSDTEFTELLVSDLPNSNRRGRVNNLSTTFHLDDEYLNASPDDTTIPRSHHHYHYHHHLGTHQVRLLNYLDGVTRSPSDGTSLFIPPILFPSDTSISQSRAMNILDTPSHLSYRWNPELGSAENRRSLLTILVDNALRSSTSSLLDGLLLRQLVYIFSFDSVPVAQESTLTRDISPEFLTANETHRHRLAAFIRRELRVIAPWLAYDVSYNSQGGHENSEDVAYYNAAVTSPLISGAPGLEVDTRELDNLTNTVLQHICTIPITNEQSLVDFLTNQSALHPSLVPSVYLHHLASEIVQFAQFTGSMEEYDSSVCLYRRRVTLGGLISSSTERHRNRYLQRHIPEPRLAVYIASACWPRLRPGFAQPEGLIIHPLINWLLQRLFVHAISGTSHPDPLPGTGDPPPSLPSPLVFHGPSLTCHPNCLRLASSCHALLEAVISFSRLRGQTSGQTINLSYDGSVSTSEIFPNRLLFQRVLSELIDHARFSEALSGQFSQYNDRTRLTCLTPRNSEENSLSSVSNQRTNSRVSIRNLINLVEPDDYLQPAIRSHLLALKRLDGLLLLFTARVPGLRNDPEHLISELLHMPLMPMTITPLAVIDLTRPRSVVSRSQTFSMQSQGRGQSSANLDTMRAPYVSRFSGIDWTYLRQPAQSLFSQTDHPVNSVTGTNTVTTSVSFGDWNSVVSNQLTTSNDVCPFRGSQIFPMISSVESGTSADGSTSVHNSPGGWRDTASYVVISSDESDEETIEYNDPCVVPVQSSVLTSDDSEPGHESSPENQTNRCESTASLGSLFSTFSNIPLQSELPAVNEFVPYSVKSTGNNKTCQPDITHISSELDNMQKGTTKLSLTSSLLSPAYTNNCSDKITEQHSAIPRCEEPMEVDERPDDIPYSVPPSSSNYNACLTALPGKSTVLSKNMNAVGPHSGKNNEGKSLANRSNILSPRNSLKHYYHSPTKYELHYRHRRRKLNINSNHLINTDSDCELIRESIRIDSDSSCSTSRSNSLSRSSSSSSNCQQISKFSSTAMRLCSSSYRCKSIHRKHHRCHHSYCGRHHLCHSRHSCCCYCHSKRHIYKHHHSSKKLINLNNPSSPVIISDGDDIDKSSEVSPETLTDNSCHLSHHSDNNEEKSLPFPTVADHNTLPRLSQGDTMFPDQSCNVPSSSKSHFLSVTDTNHATFPIYEPSTATEFYRLLAKFESQDDQSEHSKSSACESTSTAFSSFDKCSQTDSETITSTNIPDLPLCEK